MQAFKVTLAALVLVGAASLQAQSPPSQQMTVAAFLERVAELRRSGPEWRLWMAPALQA